MASAVVAELVEIPLAVPFDEFVKEHNSAFLPVLLHQPGIISVKTGTKLNNPSGPSAVSLTLWQSFEDHERFTTSQAAGPFFEKLASFTTGPPTIGHYRFNIGSEAYAQAPFTDFRKYRASTSSGLERTPLTSWSVQGGGFNAIGACLEDSQLITVALFGESANSVRERKVNPHNSGVLDVSFTVEWVSFEKAKVASPSL